MSPILDSCMQLGWPSDDDWFRQTRQLKRDMYRFVHTRDKSP